MKRKIRRFLAVLLSTTMCLSLVACGDEVVITEDNTQNAQWKLLKLFGLRRINIFRL